MTSVVLWEGQQDLSCEVLLVLTSQFEEFEEWVATGDLRVSAKHVLRVKPAIEAEIGFAYLYAYLRYAYDAKSVPSQLSKGKYSQVLNAWERVRKALHELDVSDYKRGRDELDSSMPDLMKAAISPVLSLLDDYLTGYTVISFLGSPYDTAILSTKSDAWWTSRPSWLRVLEQLESRFRKAPGIQAHGLDKLSKKLTAAKGLAEQLNLSAVPTGDPSVPFVIASSLCFAGAKAHAEVGIPTLAFLLVHRSLELMFIALGLQESLVQLTKTSVAWVGTSAFTDKPGLFNLNKALAGRLAPNSSRDDLVNAVNVTRNILHYTHGLSGTLRQEVTALLPNVRNTLKALDTSSGTWSFAVDQWESRLLLDVDLLLSPTSHFESYFDKVVLPVSL